MIMMILVGIWAIRVMPSQLDPPMHFPMVFVEVTWIGASAEDLETLVTTPIEQQLRTLSDLKEINSSTRNGHTFINVALRLRRGHQPGHGSGQAARRQHP